MRRTKITKFQGAYYVVTGLWPLVHFASFEALSGPKRDRWLVRTVGLLAAAIGLVLLRRPRESGELADLSAAAFAISDLQAFRAGQLPTYLMDAVGECLFVAGRFVANPIGRSSTRWSADSRPCAGGGCGGRCRPA